MSDTLLHILRPVLDMIPSVRKPNSQVRFKDKVLWTAITLFIYLVCS